MNLNQLYTKENILKVLIMFLRLVIIGLAVGLVVSLFQLCAYYLIEFLKDVYIVHDKGKMLIFFCVLPFIFGGILFLTTKNSNIHGGGVPQLEFNIENKKEKLNWKKDLPMMFLSSLMSFCTFAPLGAEGPSVTLGGNCALMVNDIFKKEDDETVLISAGAAFGCAFHSPIVGLAHIFEEMLHKINVLNVFKALVIMGVSFLIIHFVFPNQIAFYTIDNYLSLKDYQFTLPIIGLIILFNFVSANLFLEIIIKIKDFISNHQNSIFVKYRVVIALILFVSLAFFLGQYLSSGSIIINEQLIKPYYFIIGIILLRIILTAFSSTSNLSGGIVIPQFAIGALIGMLIIQLFKIAIPNFNVGLYANEIILLSMISFYVIVMETPITGIALIFAFVSFNHARNILLVGVIVMVLSYLISKLNKHGNLYGILKRYL